METYLNDLFLLINMVETDILKSLIGPKMGRILQIFVDNDQTEYYLREISTLSSVPVASVFRIIDRFVKLSIIDVIYIKKIKLYKLSKTKEAFILSKLFKQEISPIDVFVDKINNIGGVNQIILHGKPTKSKANILIIGDNVDSLLISDAIQGIKGAYQFIITSLALTHEQYSQMLSMGLYSGEKKIVYSSK